METPRAIVITAVVAICIAVLMSGYFTQSRKQNIKKITEETRRQTIKDEDAPNLHSPPSHSHKNTGNTKPKKGSWANAMLPFYSLGILAYVLFVVGKIMSKKYSNVRKNEHVKLSWNRPQRPNKGKAKTKITMHELRQLEDKLQETEQAVQEIFSRACDTMNATQRALESGSSSDEGRTIAAVKRFKHLSDSETDSGTEGPRSSIKERKLPHDRSHHDVPGMRRVKRAKRSVRDKNKISYSVSSSSDGTKRSVHDKNKISHSVTSSSESDGTALNAKRNGRVCSTSFRQDEVDKTPVQELDSVASLLNGDENKKELLETAQNIRKTMSELQLYLDDKKAELSDE